MLKRRLLLLLMLLNAVFVLGQGRRVTFNNNWRFLLGDDSLARLPQYNDAHWRHLDLPHDWSIEGAFNEKNSTTQAEGGLPAGIGWYRKSFVVPATPKDKDIVIDFDGIYRNSEVWINGHYLGKRPNGYVSFGYDLTQYLLFGPTKNVIAVRVDNSGQPNSRWYSGSGIYRNVWLTMANKTHFKKWATFVTTPKVDKSTATVHVATSINSIGENLAIKASIVNVKGQIVAARVSVVKGETASFDLKIQNPRLWSPQDPYLYKLNLILLQNGKPVDTYEANTGIRSFRFDQDKGFLLNGARTKIKGVCLHHDAGALGAVVNKSAIRRQLQLLKDMGCNAIRTSHNPPAPEFLDLCDKMGFLVLDEAFDMWKKKKSKHDYAENWTEWHERDLNDQILRDRNHPSVFMWSIGNEIREQFDSTGISITKELVNIVKRSDPTRPITSALSESIPEKNFIYKSGALDVVGLNYHQERYADFPKNYPGQKFIATETMSALETRGYYDQPTDSTRHWPTNAKSPFTQGNAAMSVTAYDNVAAYWGSTHEETWKIIKKYDFLSGLFVWTGFDYIGEPSPYPWPARSSYFGIIDLAGFPKDVYYMYQSEWTDKPVLHLLPHWNWKVGQTIDVWAYYNNADEDELFLNGRSLGKRTKKGDDLHVSWSVPFEPGTLKAISRKNGKLVLTDMIHTAGKPAKIQLVIDRKRLKADGNDLSYITVKILDKDNNIVPDADNLVKFKITGPASIAGVDNGSQSSMEPFKADQRKAFHGLCLAIVQAGKQKGDITFTATATGLTTATVIIKTVR